jgi:hypothetical protein
VATTFLQAPEQAARAVHELRFTSLFHPGRGVVVPCDAAGMVDMDSLSERQKLSYLAARAMIGREYAYPTVHLSH